MCSYNRVNNSYGCANSKTLNGLLKTELGFQGFVVSDWGAQHAGVATALAGLDVSMPSGDTLWGSNLALAVQNGSIPEIRLNDMVTRYVVCEAFCLNSPLDSSEIVSKRVVDFTNRAQRIIASWYYLGQDEGFPSLGHGMPTDYSQQHSIVDARNEASVPLLRQGAAEGHVLVKNNGALPLHKPRMLSLFGYSAKNPDSYVVGGTIAPGLSWSSGVEEVYLNGTLYVGGGSGSASAATAVSPFDALVMQAYNDRTALFWDFDSAEPATIDYATDACLVFINAFATEGLDRTTLADSYSDNLVLSVANQCSNTIVIIHNMGIRLVDGFVNHDNITGIIFAHGPGEASGLALVDLLYGYINPSGKLPYTVAKNESDYGLTLSPDLGEGEYIYFPQSDFTEGVFIDYRRFDKYEIEPRYEFGFGLSYTTFDFSDLSVEATASDLDEYPTGEVLQGGQEDLWDIVVRVNVTVTNSGSVAGAEVVQLYVSLPNSDVDDQAVRQLRGFDKSYLNASESTVVSFDLTRRDLSVWDVVAQKWRLQSGDYTISVGNSSRSLPLTGMVSL